MDRNFYQQKLAKEHQRDISQELVTRAMLKEAGLNTPSLKHRVKFVWGVVPIVVTVVILILLNVPR